MHHDNAKDHELPHGADAREAADHLGQPGDGKNERGGTGAGTRNRGGIASSLQPGGTAPGGGPGASVGSVGTGGASTGGGPSGSVKKSGI